MSALLPKEVSIQQAFENCWKFSKDNPKTKAITDKSTYVIAVKDRCFYFVKAIFLKEYCAL